MTRTLPFALLALATATGIVLAAPGAAHAHGDTIEFTITALGDGHPRAQARYEDGDPVDEPVAATLSAHSTDGRFLGPWPLRAVQGTPAQYTTAQPLPPGHWTVSVDAGFPALGHGEADLTITAVPENPPTPTTSPNPSSTPQPATGPATATTAPTLAATAHPATTALPAAPATPTAVRPTATPARPHNGLWATAPLAVVTAALAATATAATVLIRRRRRTTQRT